MSSNTTKCHPDNDELIYWVAMYAFQGIYGFSSILIYVINIRALNSQKNNLDRVFCRLYISSASTSIVYFLDHYLLRRFVKLGFFCDEILDFFGNPNFWLNPYKTLSSYCPIAILVLHFMISLHRFSIVAFPVEGVQLWDRFNKIFILTGFILPLAFMWFMIPCQSHAVIDPEGGGGLDIEYKKVFKLSSSLFSSLAATVFGLATLFFTIAMLIILSKINIRKLLPQEISLIIFEIIMTIFTLIYAMTQALLYYSIYIVDSPSLKAEVIRFRTFAIDIFILPQAWTLLILSKSVRRYALRFLGNKIGIELAPSTIQELRSKLNASQAPSVWNSGGASTLTTGRCSRTGGSAPIEVSEAPANINTKLSVGSITTVTNHR